MFKKDVTPGAKSKMKSSAQRALRTKIVETYPKLEPYLEEIVPKKGQLETVKLSEQRALLYMLAGAPLFFQKMDDAIMPTLRVVHQYPHCFHRLRIDRGAIRFVLSGAPLMVPGLTSVGGRLPDAEASEEDIALYGVEDLDIGTVVVMKAEGKENACLIGQLKMGTKDMKQKKKGIAIDDGHYLGDGLWKLNME